MEFLTYFLSSLLTLISPGGVALDTVAENNLRDRLYEAEQLQVRIDNTPSYQLVRGEVDRLRIAGRGLYLMPEVRLDTLEVETDRIAVNPGGLELASEEPQAALQEPLQAGVRAILTEADINRALRSPQVYNDLQSLALELFDSLLLQQLAYRYRLVDPQVELLGDRRVRFQTQIAERGYSDRLTLTVETGVKVVEGRQLQLVDPAVRINDKPAPWQLVRGLTALAREFNLARLEPLGVRSRVLHFHLTPEAVEMALFVRIESRSGTAGEVRD
jgi:hypothetical protein